MSFLLRRNKDGDDAELSRKLDGSPSAAPENGVSHAQNHAQNDDAENTAVTRWRASEAGMSETGAYGVHKRAHGIGSSHASYASTAYRQWHEDLVAASRNVAQLAELATTTVDLTHAHPTGAAQLYSGATTLLSSVVREKHSYKRAVAQLERLHQLVNRLNDSYGFAQLALTAGEAAWLPQISEPSPEPSGAQTAALSTSRDDSQAMARQGAAQEISEHGISGHGISERGEAEPAVTSAASDETASEKYQETAAQTPQNAAAPAQRQMAPEQQAAPQETTSESTQGTAATADAATATPADANTAVATAADATASSVTQPAAPIATHHSAQPATQATASRAAHTKAQRMRMPMLMRPVHVDFLPSGDAKIRLSRSAVINPQLGDVLRKAGASAHELLTVERLAESDALADAVIARLIELGRTYLTDFSYEPQALLGCFSHPGERLVRDLEAMKPFIEESGVMAALAGDERVRSLTGAPLPPGDQEDRAPEVERGVGDRDVDELHAVEAVASGRSLVIDCPPGAAGIGTIVSIAADAAASGRSVLIVPAHASTGAAIQRECEAAGVGDLVLNFWDRDTAAYRLRTGLRLEKPDVDREAVLDVRDKLVKARAQLSTFVDDLHRIDPFWEASVHDLLEKLADLTSQPDGPRTRVRFTETSITAIRDAGYEQVEQQLQEAAELGVFDGEYSDSLWATADVQTHDDAEKALALVHELREHVVPETVDAMTAVSQQTGLVPAHTPREWVDQIEMLNGISKSLDTFLPKIFTQPVEDMVIATASKEWRDEHDVHMKHSERRLIRKQLDDLVRPGATPQDLHAELQLVQERRELWSRYSHDGGWPILPQGFSHIRKQGALMEEKISGLSEFFDGSDFLAMPWEELTSKLAALEKEEGRLGTLPQRNSAFKQLTDLGLGVFIADMKARHVPAKRVNEEFRLACTSSVFERLMVDSPVLASLGPRDISDLLSQLRELDAAHVASLAEPVRRAAISEMRTFARAHRDATLSLDAILARDDTPALKEAIASYPRIVQLARPVWIMPAGLVAEYLPASPWADVCILDASADVPLYSVVAAVMRGRQGVIVGDTRRPALLAASEPDKALEKPPLAITEFARVLPSLQLPTHRVQLNELSAMALNGHGYEGVYSPVPINPRKRSTHIVLVDGYGMPSLGGDGSIETTSAEVDAVIDVIADHALDRPEQSLIVIAANERHAKRVREAFHKELASSLVLAEFAQAHPDEPFEIVDISQVAGAHRDHVVLTVGFGKTVHGRLLHSFGKLAQPQGFLGLVDAIEAAREELTVVSSIAPGDMDRAKISTPGPQLLAEVISAAKDGYVSAASGQQPQALAPLVEDLAQRLEANGWKTALNFGYSGSQKIPLVAGSDAIPGTWAVAVLLDDEAYVHERSLRRRDRHRVEAYRQAGWSVFQTYSTSLFIDPAGQAQAVERLLEEAVHSLHEPSFSVQVPTMDAAGEYVMGAGDSGANSPLAQPTGAKPAAVQPAVAESAVAEPKLAQPKLTHPEVAQAEVVKPVARAERPNISVGMPLVAYTDDELDDMLAWIASDRVPRTQSQLLEELRNELGIERRGGQIDLVLGNVVRRSGLAVPDEDSAQANGKAERAANASDTQDR
ncbi:MAG: hypothetical protein PUK59_02430 [Actinomycetaceae bacterium]|nr:hypothetical protein [Actinomycetaceae bacterium]